MGVSPSMVSQSCVSSNLIMNNTFCSHHARPFVKENVLNYLENTFGFKMWYARKRFHCGDTIPAILMPPSDTVDAVIMVISRYNFFFKNWY